METQGCVRLWALSGCSTIEILTTDFPGLGCTCAHCIAWQCMGVTFDDEVDSGMGCESGHRRHSSNTHVFSCFIIGNSLYWQYAVLRQHLRTLKEHTQNLIYTDVWIKSRLLWVSSWRRRSLMGKQKKIFYTLFPKCSDKRLKSALLHKLALTILLSLFSQESVVGRTDTHYRENQQSVSFYHTPETQQIHRLHRPHA